MKPLLRTSTGLSLALFAALGLCTGAARAASLDGWYSDLDQAMAVAKREGKPLLADIGADNCPACRQLEAVTLTAPEVRSRLKNFVKVQINGNERPDILQQFGVNLYPTVVAIDPRGQEVGRSIGFVPAARFVGTLDSALAQAAPAGASADSQEDSELSEKSLSPQLAESASARKETERELTESTGREESRQPASSVDSRSRREKTEEPELYNLTAATDSKAAAPAKSADAAAATGKTEAGKTKAESSKPAEKERMVAQAAGVSASRTAIRSASAVLERVPTTAAEGGNGATISEASNAQLPGRLLKLSSSAKSASGSISPATERESTPKAEVKLASHSRSEGGALNTIKRLQAARNRTSAEASGALSSSRAAGSDAAAIPVSAAEIKRWMTEADAHLKAGRKKEARAMYGKVVREDKENRHGESDRAYIQMVMLSVDSDDDGLRRVAYSEIKRFKALFPESDREDHYTVMRAILATDLGFTDEAHSLLDTFPTRFPNSQFKALAHRTWKSLPPVKSSTARSGSGTSRKTADSGSSSARKTGSGKK